MLEKLCIRTMPGWFVWSYKPYRTKKGHMVWRKYRIIAGPFLSHGEAKNYFPQTSARAGGLHDVKLTDDETIKALAQWPEALEDSVLDSKGEV